MDRTVFGSVLDAAGAPVSGVTVTVSMEDVHGSITVIGTTEVSTKGNYTLSYDPVLFKPQILRVSVPVNNQEHLQTIVSPAQNERVNFRVGLIAPTGTTPKFTDVSARLSGALAPTSSTLQSLEAVDVARASLFAGVHPSDTVLARDAAFSAQLSATPAALHFALGEGGLSGAVADVLKHPRADREAALARAVADGVLSAADKSAAEAALATLDTLMVDSALVPPTAIANPGHALTLAGVTDETTRKTVLNEWIAHTGTVDAFWSGLNLPVQTKTQLQFALQLDKLTRSNTSLMSALFQGNATLSQLVSLDLAGWTALVGTHAPPEFLTAAGHTASDYATAMFSEIEDEFPTPMLEARLSWFDSGGALAAFLAQAPTYRLEGDSLAVFLENGGTIPPAHEAFVRAQLPKLERLYRLAPRGTRFEVMRDLLAAGIVSSTQIQLMGRSRLEALAPSVAPIADRIFRRATTMTSISLALQTQLGARAASRRFASLPGFDEGVPSSVASSATWQQLFGGRTFCACKECQSALGPAAYLADLLFWLRTRDASFTSTFLGRRPDIGALQLSCKNTNTPLPSIDLILERLESLVGPVTTGQQTSLDADELAARPEHLNQAAYDRVAGLNDAPTFYPFDQPYVWSLDRKRTFMAALGVERATAMITRDEGGLDAALARPEIAAEVLGLTRSAWNTLTQTGRSAAELWGFARDLTRPTPSWTMANVTLDANEADPFGGNFAFKLNDSSSSAIGEATLPAGTAPGTTPANSVSYWGSIRVKKNQSGSHFAEIGVGVGGNYTGRTFFINPTDGSVAGGGITPSPAIEVDGWYLITFSVSVPEGSVLTFRVRPAAATAPPSVSALATGVTIIYAPQLATTSSLASVPAFLDRAGDRAAEQPLAYAVLEDLIRSGYVQGAGSNRVKIRFNNTTCDIDGATLVSNDPLEPYLVRMAKLLRLSRALGWSVATVDRAMTIFRTSSSGDLVEGDVNNPLLLKLARVVWLARMLGRSAESLLDWWGPLDTRRWAERVADMDISGGKERTFVPDSANAGGPEAEPSPFQRRAQRYRPGELFAVTNDGTELGVTPALSENLDAVAALVGGETAEVLVLARTLPNDTLNLANVSSLARHVDLARSLGLSAAQLVEWMTWQGTTNGSPPPLVTPLAVFASPSETLRFVAEVGRNASARLPVAAVRAAVRADSAPDLEALGVPREGTALLALGDAYRAHRAPDDPARFDLGMLTEGNLLPPLASPPMVPPEPVWTGSATEAQGEADPVGGGGAVALTDASAAATASSSRAALTGYTDNDPVWVSLWLRKDLGAAHFASVGVAYGGVPAASLSVSLVDGQRNVLLGTFASSTVVDAGEWLFVAFEHEGGSGLPSVVVAPAAGSAFPTPSVAAQGTTTVFGPRIAVAGEASASPLYEYRTRDRALTRQVAALLSLDVTLAGRLLSALRDVPANMSAFASLLEDAKLVAMERDRDPTAAASPEVIETLLARSGSKPSAWVLIATAGWMCRTFDFQATDVPYLVGTAAATARGFDLETIVYGADVSVRYAAWAKLRELARLQTVSTDGRLLDLFATWLSAPSAALAAGPLAARTGWDLPSVEAWMATEPPLTLAEPARFARMAALFEIARQTRVPFERLESWGALRWSGNFAEPDYNAAGQEAEDTIRGVWGDARWRADMPAIRERLRERQRAGLVSRLVGDATLGGTFASAPALGEHLLMDVQMGGCDRTSRVRDAIRAVQAFVQRVLLGLEGTLRLTDADAREWVWRKNYRIWEANRKVFLYPENWLRPELRRQKTPFFAQLETDLAGGDLRPELVEDAYRTYLGKLSDVSRLETLAVYREERTDGPTVSHVFARTRGTPAHYFHREREDDGAWGPWRELAKVEGEHLMPTVFQRRLMLFWLRIGDTAREPDTMPVPEADGQVQPSPRYFHIRLSWSEYRDGKWTAPTMADSHLGISERGIASTDGPLDHFVSAGVGPFESRGRRSYSPRVIYGRTRLAPDGRDLLVDVFRTAEGGRVLPLQAFRVSGVDRSVTVDAISEASSAPRPQGFGGWTFYLLGQRFIDFPQEMPDVLTSALSLPLPHASTAGSVAARVLTAAAVDPRAKIRIAAPDPLTFDSTAPFVFDDLVGSYWVTYDPQPFFVDLGLGGSYFPGGDPDLWLPSPSIPLRLAEGRSIAFAKQTTFKTEYTAGTDKLLSEGVNREAVGKGGKVVALNAQTTDGSTKRIGLTSSFVVRDASGTQVYAANAGRAWDVDDVVQVGLSYQLPLFTIAPTLFSNGFHFLLPPTAKWRFDTFFHPHIATMRETLNRLGIFGLLDPPSASEAMAGQDPQPESTLKDRYDTPGVSNEPPDDLDFSTYGAYSQYNWEIFFHAPFLIASRLHEAGKFEDALKWIRTIFDPYRPAQAGQGETEARRSYWRFRPFREEFPEGSTAPRNIQQAIALLTANADATTTAEARELLRQISDWRKNPFDPHAIAQTRTVTYMTAVVMKYLEIVLDWGDELFARDTLEAIGEASELYLLAARILGPPPEEIAASAPATKTFDQLLIEFASGVGPSESIEENVHVQTWEIVAAEDDEASSLATLLYFCVPANPDLGEKYWGRVADRLFKIRNCLDIQGRRRELALFEPPIDPDLLVRAAAAGVDLQSVMADIVTGRIPHRRYLAMAELAAGLAAGAQGLGQALLGAIEKRDADQLNTLRSTHERRLQEDAIRARQDQITELQHQRQGLVQNRAATVARLNYYRNKPRTNNREAAQLAKTQAAKGLSDIAGGFTGAAAALAVIPDLDAGPNGVGGSPKLTLAFGGRALATMFNAFARGAELGAAALEREGRMLLAESGYDRRKEDWDFQARLAEHDLKALDARLLASDIQLAMAQRALESAELRLTQIDQVTDFLERRFAREDLYEWMASELSSLHYQSYTLAYEFAKKAEKAWQYELGRSDSFIQFGYWDSRRKGLLAADKLLHDLRRMQVAYSEISSRRLEVDQTFSMRELDPIALMKLKKTGAAEIVLPEAFFDLYYPGHYSRRIRAVRLSIPAAVPPNTNLPAHVELLRHWIRKASNTTSAAELIEGGYGNAPVTMTATSTAQRDAGVFEFDFRGPKLLPFEGAGAISRWRVTLPDKVRPFDYDHIQDVHFHVAYDAAYDGLQRSAVEGTASGRTVLFNHLFAPPATGGTRRRAVSLRAEHGGALRRLIAAAQANAPLTVSIEVKDGLPVYMRSSPNTPVLQDINVVLNDAATGFSYKINGVSGGAFASWPDAGGLLASSVAAGTLGPNLNGTHTFEVTAWGGVPGPDFDITIVVDLS